MFKRFSLVGFLMFSAIFSAQKVENFKLKQYRIAVLNDSIKETSGLSFLKTNYTLLMTVEILQNCMKLIKIRERFFKP